MRRSGGFGTRSCGPPGPRSRADNWSGSGGTRGGRGAGRGGDRLLMLLGGAEFARWLGERGPARPQRQPPAEPVLVARDEGRLVIVLNVPERRNAFSAGVREELLDAVLLAEADQTIEAVRLSGAGPAFCSGGDLDEFGPRPISSRPAVRLSRAPWRVIERISPKVTVFAHGACVGAGVEMPRTRAGWWPRRTRSSPCPRYAWAWSRRGRLGERGAPDRALARGVARARRRAAARRDGAALGPGRRELAAAPAGQVTGLAGAPKSGRPAGLWARSDGHAIAEYSYRIMRTPLSARCGPDRSGGRALVDRDRSRACRISPSARTNCLSSTRRLASRPSPLGVNRPRAPPLGDDQ